VDWNAIIGGALVASVVSLILVSFGSAVGLSFVPNEPGEDISLKWMAVAVGLWVVWTAIIASVAGGYFAGRMRKPAGDTTPDEVDTRDGAHGIAVWALAALLTAALGAAGIGGAFTMVGTTAAESADTITAVVQDNADYVAGVALRNQTAAPDSDARKEVSAILVRGLKDGTVSPQDRQYLAQIVANTSTVSPDEARNRVDAAVAEVEAARENAIEAADTVRVFTLIAAFILAASLLVSGVAAYFAAVAGGNHRDRNIGFAGFWSAPRT
jgi:heme/copper-type cytochrome/quinol oxidase subunit 2